MGQLIKLQDYISRYEMDPFRYPAQYVRLKKQQWQKLKLDWENQSTSINEIHEVEEENNPRPLNIIKRLFQKSTSEKDEWIQENPQPTEPMFQFAPKLAYYPDSIDELKQMFLDQLFSFQMKWASSTIIEKSFIDKSYFRNEKLKYLLQRFPDTFLFLYEPIFLLKKAPVEMEVLLITPTEVWCIVFLEEENEAVYLGSKERFWIKRANRNESKILNPMISLNRMAKIIMQLLNYHQIDIPMKKAIISRNGYIDYPNSPVDVALLEKRKYPEWFKQQRNHLSPLKHIQLKTAKVLLDYCQTTSAKRPEWNNRDGIKENPFDISKD
ncbi:hypothetical protein B5V89_01975 [Heyndrickxia sporothermodurans]|uniref:NERD domain-containing protein n=1 Tax=Heyndrickxia sporothermodurans TaxID=46224 RepID=UPI000D3323EF|nr:NERD domain-containing protein [Heyndrickxia sporothermodurans]PTY80076.1 hypothetical protein B5V89_01975 [Heyndrickxia sporothermodurans]